MLQRLCLAVLITFSMVHNGDANLTNQSSAVASELTQIEHRLVIAWIEGDRAAVDSILAADWSVIDLTGNVLTRAQVMQELGSGVRRIESGSVDDLNIQRLAMLQSSPAGQSSQAAIRVSEPVWFNVSPMSS